MIIVYNPSGDLVRFIEGTLINAETFAADGYLVIDPGGRYDLPTEGMPFAFDEISTPVLGDRIKRAIYNDTGEFYVDAGTTPPALMEVQ